MDHRSDGPTPAAPDATIPSGRFIILFPGRTGSSWLVSALSGHPHVEVAGEILVRRSPRDQGRLIKRWLDAAPPPGSTRGFKTKLKDLAEPARLAETIARRQVGVIHMVRRDLLRLAISTINARRLFDSTGRWNRTADLPPIGPARLDAAAVVEAIDRSQAAAETLAAFVAGLDAPVLEVEYASILHRPEALLDRIQRHLGLEPRPLAGTVLKNTSMDLREAVGGFEALAEALAGTRWGHLLNEVDAAVEAPPPA